MGEKTGEVVRFSDVVDGSGRHCWEGSLWLNFKEVRANKAVFLEHGASSWGRACGLCGCLYVGVLQEGRMEGALVCIVCL